MSTLAHQFGNDLQIDASGGLALVSGAAETNQSVEHRLLTAAGGSIWHLDYGGGLPQMVGAVADLGGIQSIVTTQMALESGVDQSQPVDVALSQIGVGSYGLTVSFTDLATQTGVALTVGDQG